MKNLLLLVVSVLSITFATATAIAARSQESTSGNVSVKPKADSFDGFDNFVNDLIKEWKVPGLSIAVVKDGKVVYVKGYGYRDVERKLPMTPRTIMPIGSITKAFTGSILGTLVEEKKARMG